MSAVENAGAFVRSYFRTIPLFTRVIIVVCIAFFLFGRAVDMEGTFGLDPVTISLKESTNHPSDEHIFFIMECTGG